MSRVSRSFPQISLFRGNTYVNPITFHGGIDHILGPFLDITDDRYASLPEDEQGEGFVMEWCTLFGFQRNLIGATIDDIDDVPKLIDLVEKFINTKNQ